jgi:hypothetical protein
MVTYGPEERERDFLKFSSRLRFSPFFFFFLEDVVYFH